MLVLAAVAGIVQGARHALEPDHVTAVATVMVEETSPRRGVFYAGCWGFGHAAMLLLVAGPLLVLRIEVPPRLAAALEVVVGAMLIYLGVRSLRARMAREPRPASGLARGRRPFAIGLVHGLAGSGALAALVALGAPSAGEGVAAISFYAAGTVVGMVGLGALVGPAIAHAGRWPRALGVITRAAGATSVAVGLAWIGRTIASL